jgi:hypothetical protein
MRDTLTWIAIRRKKRMLNYLNFRTMKTLEEKNRMIAEFMGMQKTELGWYDNDEVLKLPNTSDNTFDDLLFHSSWDWLMPVIQEIKLSIEISDRFYEALDRLDNSLMDINIQQTYENVVDIIEFYNEQK